MKERKIDLSRCKLLRIPYSAVLDSIKPLHRGPDGIIHVVEPLDLPSNVVVKEVVENYKYQAFDFLIIHEDFDIVEEGACIPRIDMTLCAKRYEVVEVDDD